MPNDEDHKIRKLRLLNGPPPAARPQVIEMLEAALDEAKATGATSVYCCISGPGGDASFGSIDPTSAADSNAIVGMLTRETHRQCHVAAGDINFDLELPEDPS